MIKYVFKEAPLAIKNADKADAQVIGEALAKLSDKSGGHLTPAAVVEAAANKRSPLHRHFEWDDAVAAQSWRLDQARHLVRVIRVEEGDETPRAFLSISDKGGVSYRTLGEVRSSSALQLLVLKQAERDLEAFERRYRDLTEVCEAVSIARERVATRRQEYESRV